MPIIHFHETINHGTVDLPYAIYHTKLPDFFESYPLHWHDEIEIIYQNEGSTDLTINNVSYVSNKGDIFLVLPQTPHRIRRNKNNSSDLFNLIFAPNKICNSNTNKRLYQKYIEPFYNVSKEYPIHLKPFTKLNAELTPIIKDLISIRYDGYQSNELIYISYLYKIIHLINLYAKDIKTKTANTDKSFGFIKDAIYKIQIMYSQKITLENTAKQLKVSKSHFMKTFKKVTGKSFIAYLIDYRLEIAAKQLSEGKFKIFEISGSTGFNNESYFIRAFTKKYKVTPKQYMLMNKKKG